MFVNCTNHKYENWSMAQKEAAKVWGTVVDYPFLPVAATATSKEVAELSDSVVKDLMLMHPDAVLCQGEFNLTYDIVNRLKAEGIIVLAACSERDATEIKQADGKSVKTSIYKFVQFREY